MKRSMNIGSNMIRMKMKLKDNNPLLTQQFAGASRTPASKAGKPQKLEQTKRRGTGR
jgi:hypothetical protein